MAGTTITTEGLNSPVRRSLAQPAIFSTAIAFGIFAGFVEGIGLLAFQRINWRRWGPMVHVGKDIIWISPIVDLTFFVLIALLVRLAGFIFRRIPQIRVLVFALAFLAVYDWLLLTERLLRGACFLLALGVAFALSRWFAAHPEKSLKLVKRSVLVLAIAWACTFAGLKIIAAASERHQLASLPPAQPDAPNVLVIVIDTLRADHLSSYGYARPTTPNIDRFAAQSVIFRNAISACSWTLPSHASLLTGRYPEDHGMQNAQPMPWLGWDHKSLRGYLTMGEAVERRGYRTGAFSANQSYFTSNVGLGRGFTHFEDYFQSPKDMFVRTVYGREFDRLYLHRTARSRFTRALKVFGLEGLRDERKHAEEVNREALRWIDRGGHPFLAFLNYIDVHDAAPPQNFAAPWGLTSEIDRYDSALNYDDQQIGNLLQELDRRGLAQNTLVVITSDHGESLGQHDMLYHGIALYLEQIHVPLIIRLPGRIPAGATVTAPVSNASLSATILDVVEGHGQNAFPGAGLDELWNHPDSAANWPAPVSELAKNDIVIDPDRRARNVEPTAMDGDMKSMVTPKWHLLVHEKFGKQLYEWGRDPGETRDLIGSPEGKAALGELNSEMQKQSAP